MCTLANMLADCRGGSTVTIELLGAPFTSSSSAVVAAIFASFGPSGCFMSASGLGVFVAVTMWRRLVCTGGQPTAADGSEMTLASLITRIAYKR
jgi:hypothetical protein